MVCPVNPKQSERVESAARPVLRQDEQIEVTSFATVGTITPRQGTATAITGVMDAVRPRAFYLALTSKRLLFFGVDALSGRPDKKLARSLSRTSLSATPLRRGLLTAQFQVAITGDDKGLRFVFPRSTRTDAATMAESLVHSGPTTD